MVITSDQREEIVNRWSIILDDLMERHNSIESRQRESIRLRCGGVIFGSYHFTDEQLGPLLELAVEEPKAFEVAKREAARRLAVSREVPDCLYDFAVGVLAGTIEKPKRKSKADDDYLRALVMCVTRDVEAEEKDRTRYYDKGVRPENMHGNTACELVADALGMCTHKHNLNLDANKLNDLFLRGRLKNMATYVFKETTGLPSIPPKSPT